ncbi:hypothetical protein [Psychrobacter jeotgali]|uniref:hypothetical protein n=1 Tax=Psychrobacter jeotgali TaxID=179010 RepID=UPI00191A36E4|nr:hypothetical protein [Psychrobacter jeotgali]
MTTPNNKPSADSKRKVTKRPKSKDALPLSTWILLIISFSLLGYAIYSIQTRIIEAPVNNSEDKAKVTQAQ